MKCISKENTTPETRHLIGQRKFTKEQYNKAFPIVGYWVVNGGILVHRECAIDSLKDLRSGRRERITSMSPRSKQRLAILALSTEIHFKSILTLTYGQNYPINGEKVKYHLNFLLTKLKRRYGPFDYLWFLEFQARGAPHFHILTTLAPPNKAQRWRIARLWADIVEPQQWAYESIKWAQGEACYMGEYLTNDAVVMVHQHSKQLAHLRHLEGARRYVVKYATKTYQKFVPKAYRNVGRFWGKAWG